MKKNLLIFLALILLISGLTYADTDGVWTLAKNVRGGTFGSDEQPVTFNYSFINPVFMNRTLTINTSFGRALWAQSNVSDGIAGVTSASGYSAIYGLAKNPNSYSGYFEGGNFEVNQYSGNILVMKNGNVGIGTATPSVKLDVNGKIGANEYCDANGQNCVSAVELAKLVNNGGSCKGGHGSLTFTSDTTFIVPACVTNLTVDVVGGGGGGDGLSCGLPGEGGGGAGWRHALISVLPGTAYKITIGTGGLSSYGILGSSPVDGTASSFGNLLIAYGGHSAYRSTPGSGGGSSGAGSGGVGQKGGYTSNTEYGAAGGSSGGTYGGKGGAGAVYNGVDAQNGFNYGGGGGGGGCGIYSYSNSGHSGAPGVVVVSW